MNEQNSTQATVEVKALSRVLFTATDGTREELAQVMSNEPGYGNKTILVFGGYVVGTIAKAHDRFVVTSGHAANHEIVISYRRRKAAIMRFVKLYAEREFAALRSAITNTERTVGDALVPTVCGTCKELACSSRFDCPPTRDIGLAG